MRCKIEDRLLANKYLLFPINQLSSIRKLGGSRQRITVRRDISSDDTLFHRRGGGVVLSTTKALALNEWYKYYIKKLQNRSWMGHLRGNGLLAESL